MISRQHVFYFNFLFASLFCVLRHFYCYRCLVFVPACCFICQIILKRKHCFYWTWINFWLYIKPGIQERRTKCRKRGEWKESVMFWRMSSNIPRNFAKHSGKCHSSHFGEYRQAFRRNILINFNSQFSISYEQTLQKHRCLFFSQKLNQYI